MRYTSIKTFRAALGMIVNICSSFTIWAAQGASGPQVAWVTNAHGEPVTGIAFSNDGDRLTSGSGDETQKVWDWKNGVLVRDIDRYLNDYQMITAVAISPDGTQIAGGGDVDTTRLWDVATGRRLWAFGSEPGGVYSLAFSPNGQLVAAGRVEYTSVVDAQTAEGKYVPAVKTYSVAFSPDGALLATAVHVAPEEYEPQMGIARILRVNGFNVLHTLTGHSNHVYSVDFSPDGQLLLTTSLDGTARLWNVNDGSVVRVIEGGGGVFGKFSADGKTFFTCDGSGTVDFIPGSGTLKYWRTSGGALLASFENLGAGPIAVSPAGKYFAYGKADGSLIVAYVPLWIEQVARSDNEITLRWQGGSGRYQVQARENLNSGTWQNLGPVTTNTTFTHTCHSPMFYRVESLNNPP